MPVTIDHEAQQPEKDTQTLTIIPVYNQTAKDLATLEAELKGLVINVETPAGMKEAKKILSRLVKCRTTLESVRKEANQDLIKAKAANDDEAKRINKRVIALEEPVRAQVEKKEAEEAAAQAAKDEADRARLLRLTTAIQDVRDTPASVQGQASNIINGALQRIKAAEFAEDDFAEYWQQALDARDAVIGRLTTMLHDQKQHEAEQAQIKADREKLAQLEQEAAERRARDDAEREQREAAEAQQRAVAEAEAAEKLAVENERRRQIALIRQPFEWSSQLQTMTSEEIKDRIATHKGIERNYLNIDTFGELLAEANSAWCDSDEALIAAFDAAIEREKQEAEAIAERQREMEYEIEQRHEAEEKLRIEQQRVAELENQAVRAKKEAAAKAEADRIAGLGLREAAQAILNHFPNEPYDPIFAQLLTDLACALSNEDAKPAATKATRKKAAK